MRFVVVFKDLFIKLADNLGNQLVKNCSKYYDRQSKLALLFDHNKKNGSTFFDFLVEAVPLCYSTFIKILLSELSNTNYLFV